MLPRGHKAAVLGSEKILELSDEGVKPQNRLIDNMVEANLKGAAYDLRMADTGMVLPNGRVVKPGGPPSRSSVLLEPGQTIFASTQERINMPHTLTGNMSIKGALASVGVLSLTGLIVDPGYNRGGSGDGRLHFRLANLGSRPVLLEPGVTKIASIQFLCLDGVTERDPGKSFDNIWERADELQEGLGFIEDLRLLRKRTDELEAEAARQGRAVNLVVFGALFVVVTTLLGVIVAGLLSLGNDSHVVSAARAIVPDHRGEQIFLAVALFGVGAIIYALLSPFRVGRKRIPPDPLSAQTVRTEALRDLRMERMQKWSYAGVALALLATLIVAAGTEQWLPWYLPAAAGLIVLAVCIYKLWGWIWEPIPPAKVDERVRRWEAAG